MDKYQKFKDFVKQIILDATRLILVLSVLIIFITILYSAKYNPINILSDQYFLQDKHITRLICSHEKLSYDHKKTLEDLVQNGTIISVSDGLNSIHAYYNNLITFLIALMGLSALIGFLYIKGITEEQAEKKIEKILQQTFASCKFQNELKELISNKFDEEMEDTEIGNLKRIVTGIQEQLELLNIDFDLSIQKEKHGNNKKN